MALTLPAGHLADRRHRGRIVAVCLLVQTVVAVLLCAGTAGDAASRGLLLGVSLVLGAVRAFQMPA